jgi:hypothetical protein
MEVRWDQDAAWASWLESPGGIVERGFHPVFLKAGQGLWIIVMAVDHRLASASIRASPASSATPSMASSVASFQAGKSTLAIGTVDR